MRRILLFAIAAVIALSPQVANALDPIPIDDMTNDIEFYGASSGLCTTNVAAAKDLSKNIPADWGKVFSEAAAKFDVNPNFLAALYLTENGNVWKPFDTNWASSYAGASGPMQFMPGTWSAHAQDGDGDGKADINNVYDAVYGAADLVKSMGATADTPLGDIKQPWRDKKTLLFISAAYNWGPGNASSRTTEFGDLSQAPTETENYLKNIEALFSSDFTKSGHPSYGDPRTLGAESNSNGSSSGNTSNATYSANCDYADGAVAGNIVETAKSFAHDQPVPNGTIGESNAKPAFVQAIKDYNPGVNTQDCGMFVATVMRASKVDSDYPPAGTGVQLAYVRAHPEKYKIIESPQMSDLQPGDILIVHSGSAQHTSIYTGEIGTDNSTGDKLVMIDASLNERVPSYRTTSNLNWMLSRPGVIAARAIVTINA